MVFIIKGVLVAVCSGPLLRGGRRWRLALGLSLAIHGLRLFGYSVLSKFDLLLGVWSKGWRLASRLLSTASVS